MLAFITLCEFRHIVMLKSFPLAYLSRRLQRECVINNKTWRGGGGANCHPFSAVPLNTETVMLAIAL